MTPETLFSLSIPLFADLSGDDLDGIHLDAHVESYKAGQTVLDQDSPSKDVYFLLSGGLMALYWTKDGREVIFTRFPVGACLGELGAFDEGPRSLGVFAKTPARLLRLSRKTFLELYDTNQVFRRHVTLNLVMRIRDLPDRALELTTLSIEQRVCSYLIRLSLDTGCVSAGSVITGAPTHAEIGNSIGANREMVSRTMTRLAKRGAIRASRQRIEILDQDLLSAPLEN